jgi:hypothetical protein
MIPGKLKDPRYMDYRRGQNWEDGKSSNNEILILTLFNY